MNAADLALVAKLNALPPTVRPKEYGARIEYAGKAVVHELVFSPEQEASIQKFYDDARAKGSPCFVGD
jgi:hypothetical protein